MQLSRAGNPLTVILAAGFGDDDPFVKSWLKELFL